MSAVMREREALIDETLDVLQKVRSCGDDDTRIAETLKNLSPAATRLMVDTALVATQKGHYQQAIDAFELLTLREPLNSSYWMALGIARQEQKEYEEALDAYAIVQGLTFVDPLPAFYAAQCRFALGEHEGALACLEAAEDFCRMDTESTRDLLPAVLALRESWQGD